MKKIFQSTILKSFWVVIVSGLLILPVRSQSVVLDSSNLPLLVIDTNGQEIPDEPKVNVDLKIIHHFGIMPNHPADFGNVYTGKAGIEIRGMYSASLPQKPYGLETRDEAGENLNVPILDMPKENDWILIPNYNDKVFMRNILAFHLFEKMGHYAPRAHLCEVLLNDEYQGVYVLTEKIKRDKNRVDIAKLDNDDNAGDSLTGGYIVKIGNPNQIIWISDYPNPNYPNDEVYFVPEYPSVADFTHEQYEYIKATIGEFEDALWGPDFKDPVKGYRNHIDVGSFIDYFLISEFSQNEDGYKKSRRLYKDKDSKDPLIYAGPVWDFDWAFKVKNHDWENSIGWRYNFSGLSDVKPPGWYIRLLEDSWFSNKLNCRFLELKETIFSTEYLTHYIDSVASLVDEAQKRHYERWPILDLHVGSPEIWEQPATYEGHVAKFTNWILDRMNWLSANMPGDCSALDVQESYEDNHEIRIFPNPTTDFITIETDHPGQNFIEIISLNGKLIYSSILRTTLHQIDFSSFQKGIYFITIRSETSVTTEKIVKL